MAVLKLKIAPMKTFRSQNGWQYTIPLHKTFQKRESIQYLKDNVSFLAADRPAAFVKSVENKQKILECQYMAIYHL